MPAIPALRRLVLAGAATAAAVALVAPAATASAPSWTPLLSGDVSTFDTSLGGWTGLWGGQVADVTSPVFAGTGALSMTNPGTATASMIGARSPLQPASPGQRYAVQAEVSAATTGEVADTVVDFYDATGKQLDSAWGQTVTDSAAGWTLTYRAVGIAPPGTASVAAIVLWGNVTPGETHYADSVTLTSSAAPAPAVAGPLHTSGNRIYDVHGNQVVLRGVYRWGMENDVATGGPTQDDINHAKGWGANVVRVGLGEPYWLSNSCAYDSTYASRVDSIVNWVTSQGMVALLDLHWNTITSCGTPGQQMMADYPNSVTFWKQVAARYKNNPLVAFDLYNEPHDISDAVWLNGGYVTSGTTTFKAAGMQQLYNAVRGTGATNLVFASGNNWASVWPSTAPQLKGTNLVYAVHAYTCPTGLTNCSKPNPIDPTSILGGWATPGQTYPVMVTEFGWPDPSDGRYIANVIAYADGQGWGYATYAWGATTDGEWDLLYTAGPGTNYMPKPSGESLLYGLAANG